MSAPGAADRGAADGRAGARGGLPDDLAFRTAAAPGLDEDDLFVALTYGVAGGALWGDGRAWPDCGPDRPWSEEEERRARHERLMRTWRVVDDEPPPAR